MYIFRVQTPRDRRAGGHCCCAMYNMCMRMGWKGGGGDGGFEMVIRVPTTFLVACSACSRRLLLVVPYYCFSVCVLSAPWRR